MNQSEIPRLMSAPDRQTLAGKRDAALLETIYTAGLRLSEATGLKTKDVDLVQRMIKVAGKGRKERLLPIGRPAARAIKAYLEADPAGADIRVFRNLKGNPIANRSVERIVGGYLAKIGRTDLTVHSLRHSFATHMLENGCGLREIGEFMGHVSLNTTQRYTHVNTKMLKSGYAVMDGIRSDMDQEEMFCPIPTY